MKYENFQKTELITSSSIEQIQTYLKYLKEHNNVIK